MVFGTVAIQKRKNSTKWNCSDVFRFFMEGEYDEVFHILQDAIQVFSSDNIYNVKWTILREEKEIGIWIKDFPNRKKRNLEKDLKKFSDKLLELTGT